MPREEKAQNATVHVVPRQRRLLFHQPLPVYQAIQKSREKWSDTEIEALVESVMLHSAGDSWPTHKQDSFWSSAGELLHMRTNSSMCRTGKNFRRKVHGVCKI